MGPKRTVSPCNPAVPAGSDTPARSTSRKNPKAGSVTEHKASDAQQSTPVYWPAKSVKSLAGQRRFRFGWSSSRARKTPASPFDPVTTRAFEHHWRAMNRLLERHVSWVKNPETAIHLRMGLDPGQVIASAEAHDVDMAMQHLMALQTITRKRKAGWL